MVSGILVGFPNNCSALNLDQCESFFIASFRYPLTVATNCLAQRRVILDAMKRTGGSLDTVDFKLNDFGFRGSTSRESAGLGGAAHLTVFKGTDSLEALVVARRFYGPEGLVAGHSVPATEHR